MNYTEDIRNAVDFMESHITEHLDYAEITVIHQFHHDKNRSYVEILIPIERAK